MTGKLSQLNFKITPIKITRTKLFLFGLTLIAVGFAMGGLKSGTPEADVSSKVVNLNLPDRETIQVPALNEIIQGVDEKALIPEIEQWESVTVRSGQSLDGIFRKQGFSANTLHKIMTANGDTRQLKKIRPGDLFEFQRHEDGSLKRMRYAIDEDRYLLIDYDGQQIVASSEARDMITEITETSGTITSSLFLAKRRVRRG